MEIFQWIIASRVIQLRICEQGQGAASPRHSSELPRLKPGYFMRFFDLTMASTICIPWKYTKVLWLSNDAMCGDGLTWS